MPGAHPLTLPVAIAFVAVALLSLPAAARADEDERRLSVRARTDFATVEAFHTEERTFAYGGSSGVGYGLRNWLDLGAELGYLTWTNVAFENATLDGGDADGGEGYTAYANLHQVELAGRVRFAIDSPLFVRVHPTAAVRAGVAMRMLTAPELFSRSTRVATSDTDFSLFGMLGAEGGLAWRISGGLEISAVATATLASPQRSYGLGLEVSWLKY